MRTHDEDTRFLREWDRLTHEQQARFGRALQQFIGGLRSGHMPPGLRVKRYQGSDNVFEMTWAPDGRALFRYGDEIHAGQPHVQWLRIGTHDILD
jgi:hypothetical protein